MPKKKKYCDIVITNRPSSIPRELMRKVWRELRAERLAKAGEGRKTVAKAS